MEAAWYAEQFLEKVFYFSLRKTGNEHDAEELAGEISCEVLASLRRGAKPASFQAWVWRIARNRWARWAKARYGTSIPAMEDIDAVAVEAEDDVEQAVITSDEARRLRRALAFIHSDYRTLLVAHYFEEKSVSAIARDLNLPVGTVKTRLIRSRKAIKEGMDMARDFGRRSFAPENVSFVNNCNHFGGNGQPWTILEHLLYQNIFLEVYDNPETAEELSLELGVALPYMEAELNYLTRETFLRREGDRYVTDFPIISKEAQERIARRLREITGELTALITAELDEYAAACDRLGEPVQGTTQSYEDAKWTLLMRAVDIHRWAVSEQLERVYPKRPDGGEWSIVGFQTMELEEPQQVGQHGGYMVEQAHLPFVSYNAYRFNFRGIRHRMKDFYDHAEIAALELVCEGKAELCEKELLDRLAEYGLIRREGEAWAPCILVFHGNGTSRLFERFTGEEQASIHDKARRIETLLKAAHAFGKEAILCDLPEHFREDQQSLALIEDLALNERGYVLEEAFRTGWLKDDENTARCIGAWINL